MPTCAASSSPAASRACSRSRSRPSFAKQRQALRLLHEQGRQRGRLGAARAQGRGEHPARSPPARCEIPDTESQPQRRAAAVRARRDALLRRRRRRRRRRPARCARQRPESRRAARQAAAHRRRHAQRRAARTASRRTTRSSASPAGGPRSGRSACAIRGASRSTARTAISGSAMSARTSGRRSTTSSTASAASTSAGTATRAATTSRRTRRWPAGKLRRPVAEYSHSRRLQHHGRLRLSRAEDRRPQRALRLRRLLLRQDVDALDLRRRADATSRASSATRARSRSSRSEQDGSGMLYVCSAEGTHLPLRLALAAALACGGRSGARRSGAADVRRGRGRGRRHAERPAGGRARPRDAHGAHRAERRCARDAHVRAAHARGRDARLPRAAARRGRELRGRAGTRSICRSARTACAAGCRPPGLQPYVVRWRIRIELGQRRLIAYEGGRERLRLTVGDRHAPARRRRPARSTCSSALYLRNPHGPVRAGRARPLELLAGADRLDARRAGRDPRHRRARARSATPSRTAACACATSRCGSCCAACRRARRSTIVA